jgi:hypothetical protein
MSDGFSILAAAIKAHDLVHPTRRGIFFIKTGGVLAGSAGYFLKWAGYKLDIGGVSQLLET